MAQSDMMVSGIVGSCSIDLQIASATLAQIWLKFERGTHHLDIDEAAIQRRLCSRIISIIVRALNPSSAQVLSEKSEDKIKPF
jgi:hypothetical protein